MKSGVGFGGFSTFSVRSSPKEAIDYGKGSTLRESEMSLHMERQLLERKWYGEICCYFLEFKKSDFSDNKKKVTNFSVNVKVSRETL